MELRYIDLTTALAVNRHLLSTAGEGEHATNVPCVEAALALPAQAFFGVELYPGIPAKAAAYLFHFTQKHCYGQGNKRTAWMLMRLFLTMNGYDLGGQYYRASGAIRLTLEIAKSRCTMEQAATWIGRRLVQPRPPRLKLA